MICDEVAALLRKSSLSRDEGSTCIVPTDCYYPSSELVCAHVTKIGDTYRVTDGGDLARVVYLHGRGRSALASGLSLAADRYSLTIEEEGLAADGVSDSWLPSAIRAIANGAALAAFEAIGLVSSGKDKALLDAIIAEVSKVVAHDRIKQSYRAIGTSGKEWTIDLAITGMARPLLINGVKSHPNSISASFTAFSDIGDFDAVRWAVSREPLRPADASLMSRVAKIVPLISLQEGTTRALSLH